MKAVAYVDGSYNAATGVYGAGAVLFIGDAQEPLTYGFAGNDPEFAKSRNVAGEIMGVCAVLEACKRIEGLEELAVYYDYAGIEAWPRRAWRAKSTIAQAYVQAYDNIAYPVVFRKVKAHTGVEYNEMADRLAKRACGLA